MSFSERVPSPDWVALTHMGEEVAEAWSLTEGGRFTVVFLVPQHRLEGDDPIRRVTIETLLTAAAISKDEVETWRLGDGSQSGVGGADAELSQPLPPPPPDETHLTVFVDLKPLPQDEPIGNIPLEKWQALDAVWKAILILEAGIDSSRLSADGLRGELEAAFKKPLGVEEKNYALQADVAQWTKAKNRAHHALPKIREFIHRATWAAASAERKQLGEIIKCHVEPRVPLPGVDKVRERLEHLQKDRQVLSAQGNAVQQEGRGILGEIRNALSMLQRNAADRARQKRSAGREKGKHF